MEKASKEGVAIVGHTPGPWEVEVISAEFTDEGHVVGNYKVTFPTKEVWIPEMKANAQLMAAAPRIFEALKDCIEALKEMHPIMNPKEPCVVYSAWEEAKIALAKAEGKK